MNKAGDNGATKRHGAPQPSKLSVAQENAVDTLVSGKTDSETAALVGVNRVTVTRWRLYSPAFLAALNLRRIEVWSAGAERLRTLIPKAIDVLGSELENAASPNRVKCALELLRLVPPSLTEIGPTDADQIIRERVAERRERLRRAREQKAFEQLASFADTSGLPPLPTEEELFAEEAKTIELQIQEHDTQKEEGPN